MKNIQQHYIDYVMDFAKENRIHIWLSGSFLHKTSTAFSDVDISAFCNAELLKKLIYGYGNPVYISYTQNPLGLLIVIYENGVAVDLEVIEGIEISDGVFFHTDDIKTYHYNRNEKLCKQFSLNNDIHYQTARLFHRSLIKFLSGKYEMGASIANEIAVFHNCNAYVNKTNYKDGIIYLLKSFNEQYPLPIDYLYILWKLIENLDEPN
ncbi:MAG: hypothetical protein IKL24_00415 [Clostridia bacterium]|nr:hypothetical protein [Clostridia bacterium]